jgi:hypothetical protein
MPAEVLADRTHRRRAGHKKHKERNDRVVAVEQENHRFADIRHIDDLGKTFVREVERKRKRIADGIRAASRH